MLTAYDYDRQCWIIGEPARALLCRQLSEELALVLSPDGPRYLYNSGPGAPSQAEAAACLRAQLADLER